MKLSLVRLVSFSILLLYLQSCMSAKESIYAVNLQAGTDTVPVAKYSSEQKIQVADVVLVQVNGLDPQVVMEFNMQGQAGNMQGVGGRGMGQRVSEAGTITVPHLGEVGIAGLTVEDASEKIRIGISRYVKEPSVLVSVLNYKVSVLGAVRSPGQYTSQTDRITILDALAQAGDIQFSGLRDRVWVIREVDGKRTYQQINLNKSDLFQSDFYYLKNNDVVYVQPNAMTSFFGGNTALFSTIGAIGGIVALIVALAK
jgi:polysaccharide export outer membrane protein